MSYWKLFEYFSENVINKKIKNGEEFKNLIKMNRRYFTVFLKYNNIVLPCKIESEDVVVGI